MLMIVTYQSYSTLRRNTIYITLSSKTDNRSPRTRTFFFSLPLPLLLVCQPLLGLGLRRSTLSPADPIDLSFVRPTGLPVSLEFWIFPFSPYRSLVSRTSAFEVAPLALEVFALQAEDPPALEAFAILVDDQVVKAVVANLSSAVLHVHLLHLTQLSAFPRWPATAAPSREPGGLAPPTGRSAPVALPLAAHCLARKPVCIVVWIRHLHQHLRHLHQHLLEHQAMLDLQEPPLSWLQRFRRLSPPFSCPQPGYADHAERRSIPCRWTWL